MLFSRPARAQQGSRAGLSIPILSTEGALAEVERLAGSAEAEPSASGITLFPRGRRQFNGQSDCPRGQELSARGSF